MIKFFLKLNLLIILLVLTVSCSQAGNSNRGLSSKVTVIPAPYGIGDAITPSRPTIFISRGQYTCRPRPVNPRILIAYLKKSSLADSGFSNIFGISEEELGLIENQSVSERIFDNSGPLREDVGGGGEGWLKLGLFISNGNVGKQNFFLIVDSVSFVASAQYRNESFQASNDIQAGYCSGSGESISTPTGGAQAADISQQENVDLGSPFLYIIPPGQKVTYSPTSPNPFHNLTLYLSGFPIIDRTAELAPDQKRRIDSVDGNTNTASQASANERTFYSGDSLIVIPRYTVDLTLRGYFTTPEGEPVAAFTKRVRFFTQSSTDF